jgi:hypothetical protein
MSPRLKSIAVLLGVFALGGVTGGGVVRLVTLRRFHAMLDAPPMIVRQKAFIAALSRDVDLDDQQLDEVRRIVQTHEPELREIRRSIGPKTAQLRARTLEDVRRVIRPDQAAKFQRFVERQEKRARHEGEAVGAEVDGGAP